MISYSFQEDGFHYFDVYLPTAEILGVVDWARETWGKQACRQYLYHQRAPQGRNRKKRVFQWMYPVHDMDFVGGDEIVNGMSYLRVCLATPDAAALFKLTYK